jgi:hypothetical protein
MPLSEKELLVAAQELRAQVRQRAGLSADWERASPGMREWYLMLAKRTDSVTAN